MSVYSVTMQNQTTVASGDLVIVHTDSTLATAGSNIEILRAWAGQGATETSDQLGIMLALQASAFGTYVARTPAPHFIGGKISGITGATTGAEGTAGVAASANAAGTKTPIIYDGFNNVAGWLWVPVPEDRIVIPADTAIVLALVGTPATLTNWSAGITFREL
jgi:hypothetical protein